MQHFNIISKHYYTADTQFSENYFDASASNFEDSRNFLESLRKTIHVNLSFTVNSKMYFILNTSQLNSNSFDGVGLLIFKFKTCEKLL